MLPPGGLAHLVKRRPRVHFLFFLVFSARLTAPSCVHGASRASTHVLHTRVGTRAPLPGVRRRRGSVLRLGPTFLFFFLPAIAASRPRRPCTTRAASGTHLQGALRSAWACVWWHVARPGIVRPGFSRAVATSHAPEFTHLPERRRHGDVARIQNPLLQWNRL